VQANSKSGFLAGDKLTWADIATFSILRLAAWGLSFIFIVIKYSGEILEKHPVCSAAHGVFVSRVLVATHPPTPSQGGCAASFLFLIFFMSPQSESSCRIYGPQNGPPPGVMLAACQPACSRRFSYTVPKTYGGYEEF
jgi:hypothetical protein